MTTKQKLRRTIAFLIIITITVLGLSEGMKSTSPISVCNIKGFYQEEKNTVDVAMIGSSEIYTSYSPTHAWKQFGYTSYNFASPGTPGNLYKYMLQEVLSRQKPKVVVFEINGFVQGNKYFEREPFIHCVIDNMRWGEAKRDAIETVIPEEHHKYYYFPLMTYHNSYTTPGKTAANVIMKAIIAAKGVSNMKGYSTFSARTSEKEQYVFDRFSVTKTTQRELQKLMDYCKEQGIEHVLFYRAPHQYLRENQEDLEQVWQLVKDNGFDYLDCSTRLEEIGIDTKEDYYDRDHLNVYGMEKFTAYFGNYLQENYKLKTDLSEQQATKWDRCADKVQQVVGKLKTDIANEDCRFYTEQAAYFRAVKHPLAKD